MKFGMNMLLWTSDVSEQHSEILEALKKMGYDGVELPIFEMDRSRFQMLGKRLGDMGLERTAVTVCTAEANPISSSAVIRQAGLDRLKHAITCCNAAGATLLCGPMHSALGEFTGSGPTDDEWGWGKDVLRSAAEFAASANVMLALEAVNRFECYFLNSTVHAAGFCREVGHPNLRTMWDTFHSHIEEKNLIESIFASNDMITHVHISECDRSTPGEGQVDFKRTFAALRDCKYDGWMTVEAFGLALPALAAATKIWRKMYKDELTLAKEALLFMRGRFDD